EGANFESEVLDESKAKSSDTSERTGVKPGVLDVSKADSSKSDNVISVKYTYPFIPKMYGSDKYHKKTVKNGQTRTQERKSVQELEAK
ncbi:hypothetical protein Tco_1179923, partial [Tanacetum coccineum]